MYNTYQELWELQNTTSSVHSYQNVTITPQCLQDVGYNNDDRTVVMVMVRMLMMAGDSDDDDDNSDDDNDDTTAF